LTGQLFISLLNPGIDLLLAVAFFLLWLGRRDQHYVLFAAATYAMLMTAFLIQDVGPVLPMELQRIPSNFGFLLSGCLLVIATLRRYDLVVPWRALVVTVVLSMAAYLWFMLVQPNITARIYAISLGIGVIALLIVTALRPIKKPHLIDHILFWVAILSAANFILRPIVILSLVGNVASYDGFQQSIYWSTVQFSQAMISILFALSLMVAVAIDLIAELRQQADSDQLSGLLNRRGFEAAAEAALRRCAAEGLPAALLIADLDYFKQVNDTYGHAVGDAVIAAFGAHARAVGSEGMIAGRIGGEEFAVLLPGQGIEAARQLAEAVRTGLAAASAGRVPASLIPTTSIGTSASYGAGLSHLMRQADQALYDAKRAGRNCVRSFTPTPILRTAASP
jgi:diguanylate cyclase (GGDEF)-like protein